MQSQDLQKHQWKNRLIIIASPTFDNDAAQIQLAFLKNNKEGLKDRKLVVYHVTNGGYSIDFASEILVSGNSTSEITHFNVALIGLDGTEKFHARSPQSAQKFYDLIDQMPMRKAELNRTNDN